MCPDCRKEKECPIETQSGNKICVGCAINRVCQSKLTDSFKVEKSLLLYLVGEIRDLKADIKVLHKHFDAMVAFYTL